MIYKIEGAGARVLKRLGTDNLTIFLGPKAPKVCGKLDKQ